jgi:hypothetical protein
MSKRRSQRFGLAASAALVLLGITGAWSCGGGGSSGGGDTSFASNTVGGGNGGGSGGAGGATGITGTGGGATTDSNGIPKPTGSDLCGKGVPSCMQQSLGPTGKPKSQFPLPTDDPKPTNVTAEGVSRDPNGFLGLDVKKTQTDYLWIADDMNYGVGLVSKVHTKPYPNAPTYREVARYASVTCQSDLANGSTEGVVYGTDVKQALCADGVHGCCSRDETKKGPNGGHLPINLVANRPSRTAVDFNGDMWVANRAFGRQPSVTKIASDPKRCIDRNKNGKIDTSSDVNGDGIITTDCDGDNLPDNGSTQCAAGQSHEFYGLDDECILFTVAYGDVDTYGRPLTLVPPENNEFGPAQTSSNAWVGTWKDGMFFRINGDTGLIETTVKIADQGNVPSHPYGAVVDQYGILWAPNEGETHLFYFDTKDPTKQGMASADGVGGTGFYGIAVDGFILPGESKARQQIWLGEIGSSGAYRYRPVRDQGFAGLGQGTWARAAFDGDGVVKQGRGIGVDNRQPKSFAWVALDGGAVGRIPTDLPDQVSTLLASTAVFPTGQGGTLGAGVASNLDVWGVNQGASSATHFTVDGNGDISGAPDTIPLDDKPQAGNDFCPLGNCKPQPYTYSDFTGFGLVNFTSPKGYYAWIQDGCGGSAKTHWYAVAFDADVPQDTTVTVAARAADSLADLEKASFTGEYSKSPAELTAAPGPLPANPARYIQVRFTLATNGVTSPKLKGFQIAYSCEQAPQ